MQPQQNQTVDSPLYWPARERGPQMSSRPGDVVHLPIMPVGTQVARSSPLAAAPAPVPSSYHTVLLMPAEERRAALAGSLWDVGMLVTAFASMREAEGVLVGEHVHAVLLDARLGTSAAVTLCQWLRASGKGHVRVVVMGEELDGQSRASLLGAGVSHVVPRPEQTQGFARQFAQAMGFGSLGWR